MNCQEFQSTLNDTGLEARTDAAEAHAAGCAPCAALLSDARALTAGLRALSAETADACAPTRVEADLLAAFRAQRAARPAVKRIAPEVAAARPSAGEQLSTEVNASPSAVSAFAPAATRESAAVVVPFPAKRWSWSHTFGAAGLAAAAAVAFVLVVPPLLTERRAERATSQADSRTAARANAERPHEAKIIVPPGDAVAEVDQDDPVEKEQTPPAVVHAPRPSRAAMMTGVKYNGGGGASRRDGARTTAPPPAAGEREEITTEFIPLAQGGGFAAGEGGHVVRVELPRTALARFGLPVNAEFASGRVKADLLLGEDGMARAIRFVR